MDCINNKKISMLRQCNDLYNKKKNFRIINTHMKRVNIQSSEVINTVVKRI